jgi:serine protease Do
MGNKNRSKKIVLVGVLMLVAGLLVGSSINPPRASADVFTDLLGRLVAPFTAAVSTSGASSTNNAVSLYQPAVDYENAVINAVKQASPSVVSITISENVPVIENCAYNPFQNAPPEFQQFLGNGSSGFTTPCATGQTQLQQIGGGSGFIISSDGLILTNKHVVSDANASYSVLTNDGKTYAAKVLARDPGQDLAVVKINATGLPTVSFGDSNGIQLGQSAIAIGNALGEFSNTVSVGVVSGLGRTVTASEPTTGAAETLQGVIQTDAAINPGNSGGPLLNLQGQVIGINTAIASNAQSIGFAIPINQAKRDITSVQTTGQIEAPYLGVRYTLLTPALAQQQSLSVNNGALVQGTGNTPAVQPGSPAAIAGIQAGDVIVQLDGQPIDATHDLSVLINQHSVGDKITLLINRKGQEITVSVTLAKRPQ